VYGITNGSAYRGDWGHSVSGRVVTVEGWGDHSTNGYIDAATATSIVQAVQAESTTSDFPLIDFGAGGIDAATAGQIATNVVAAQTAESPVQPVALADGYVTFWSTGREEQIYVAQGVATVRWMRAAGSLTNASTIATYLCLSNWTTYFQTSNCTNFSTNGLSYNGGTNLAVLWSMPGSTNHVYKLIK
jgi:peptidoglycan/LPS O-acetylase OafA/YrhL